MILTWRDGPFKGQTLDWDELKAAGRVYRQMMRDYVEVSINGIDWPFMIVEGTDGGGPYILWREP